MAPMLTKTKPVRSTALMQASRGRSCVRCGADDGTVVRAHYQGCRQQTYGKGAGIKGHDVIAADLCRACHDVMDHDARSTATSEEFSHLCWLTLIRDIEDGVIGVPK